MGARLVDHLTDTQDLERYVGQQIRHRRIMLGLTQQQLAELVGITYQQAHKYERGINRVSAGRLYQIARVLDVDVSYFFEDISDTVGATPLSRERICLDVARNFAQISDTRKQEALAQLMRSIAERD